MRFTIITVCYNAEKDIRKTIESVLEQAEREFQYIIKDGASTDGTLQIIREMTSGDSRVIVETGSDLGIYDAMNRAVQKAEGEYIFFLNAGDTFYDGDVLSKICHEIEVTNADVLYGDILFKSKENDWVKKYRGLYQYKWIYLLGDCICHQAMFAKKELFVEKLFDTKYRICADRDWQLFYLTKGKSFKAVKIPVAEVPIEGFSLQNVSVFEEEVLSCLKEHYVNAAWIYKSINVIKKNSFVKRILGR